MNDKFNNSLLKMKKYFMGLKSIIITILIWQFFLTLFTFTLANFIILIIVGIIYLLNLFIFI